MSSFFRNVDSRYDPPCELFVNSEINCLKARSIVIDTEEGVLNQLTKSKLGELFDPQQYICDVGGAGNNWAHGY